MNVNPRQKKEEVSLHSCSDEEEVCIQEADGRRVGKILWVIPMIGKSENIFCELIVICLDNHEDRHVNVEVIFVKTDVFHFLAGLSRMVRFVKNVVLRA